MAFASATSNSIGVSTQASILAWEKPFSPYYLHSGYNPGTILVTQPFTEENYATWSESVIYALDSKNKTDFMDGTIKAPLSTLDPIYPAWKCCNRMVLSWLLNSMTKDLIANVIYLNTAYAV
ncbi:uncharacterized protein LOC112004217 [Quercus suber]|uniref:uncharacterized protein LOC112004217 n=1 Tax=Quercus suber TaxID=58331 RepID=UPI000CE2233F|nr:uncharacterized protein LOC112004217 [Quercus suber]